LILQALILLLDVIELEVRRSSCRRTNLRNSLALLAATKAPLDFDDNQMASVVDTPEIAFTIRTVPEPDDSAGLPLIQMTQEAWIVHKKLLDAMFGCSLNEAFRVQLPPWIQLECRH
jgi:hypothetical protein